MSYSLGASTPSYYSVSVSSGNHHSDVKGRPGLLYAIGLGVACAVAVYCAEVAATQFHVTSVTRPTVVLPAQAAAQLSSAMPVQAVAGPQRPIAGLQAGGPAAQAAGEGPASFVRRLKVGSALFLLATVCIETLRSFAAQKRPIAMAGHSGIRAGTALKAAEEEDLEIVDVLQKERDEKARKIAELRAQEKFMKLGTGSYQCPNCGYVYQSTKGDPEYPIAPGTQFADLPGDWACPVCGSPKDKFASDGVEVAGFAVNQGYGLGTNSMTGEQKSLVIYGTLLVFFLLFLAGYGLN